MTLCRIKSAQLDYWHRLSKVVVSVVPMMLVLGCEQIPKFVAPVDVSLEAFISPVSDKDSLANDGFSAANDDRQGFGTTDKTERRQTPNITQGTRLASLAEQLNGVAIERSVALQDVQSAEAEQSARLFELYPQLTPTASAPLIGGGEAQAGLSIEQLIWDSGRVRANLTDAHLKIIEARLRAWQERNETVYDGLRAYVNMSRYQTRLGLLDQVGKELEEIKALLNARLSAGISDRGELLRMNVEQQEIRRLIVADASAMRQAQTDLLRLLPDAQAFGFLPDMEAAISQCSRAWPSNEAPLDALAKVAAARTEVSEKVILARRFPKVVLTGGTSYSRNGWSDPVVGIRLDASDILGIGRSSKIEEAAAASRRAAQATYRLQKEDTLTKLVQLDADYKGAREDEVALESLVQENLATLTLYEKQLGAGSIALTDGITFHREATDTQIALIDVRADMLLNCLQASKERGLLADVNIEINEDTN